MVEAVPTGRLRAVGCIVSLDFGQMCIIRYKYRRIKIKMKVVWFVFAIVIVVLLFVARKESSGRHDQDIQEITMGHIVYKSNLSAAPSQMLRASVEEDSVRLDTRESVTACQPHVVFTTFKCPKCDSLRQKIEDNIEEQQQWRKC